MDYALFNAQAYVIIIVRAYTYLHTGVGHADSESAQHFADSEQKQ